MASSVHSPNLTFLTHRSRNPNSIPNLTTFTTIHCGPRDNRGPLVKGRILSIEAIQAIQTLKRAQRSDLTNLSTTITKTLSRLLKSDLIACLRELLRQDQCVLALQVFSAVRSEYNPDLSLYADVVSALARSGMVDDIDRLICDLEETGVIDCDDKGLIRLIKAVIGAERRESTVKIYGLMKRNGWGSGADDYMARVLSRGLRKMGEVELADEIVKEFGILLYKANAVITH